MLTSLRVSDVINTLKTWTPLASTPTQECWVAQKHYTPHGFIF